MAEAVNRTIREGDVTHHAEVIALSLAQKTTSAGSSFATARFIPLSSHARCAPYCQIREAWVSRVVYRLGSPVMGGLSKMEHLA